MSEKQKYIDLLEQEIEFARNTVVGSQFILGLKQALDVVKNEKANKSE